MKEGTKMRLGKKASWVLIVLAARDAIGSSILAAVVLLQIVKSRSERRKAADVGSEKRIGYLD